MQKIFDNDHVDEIPEEDINQKNRVGYYRILWSITTKSKNPTKSASCSTRLLNAMVYP